MELITLNNYNNFISFFDFGSINYYYLLFFSANLKSLYLNISTSILIRDHLAVVMKMVYGPENSKDESKLYIINATNYRKDTLENIKITELDKNYKLLNTIIAKKADIKFNEWKLFNVKIYSDVRETKDMINYTYSSSFNGKIISNLYSNLNSLNIFQLIS